MFPTSVLHMEIRVVDITSSQRQLLEFIDITWKTLDMCVPSDNRVSPHGKVAYFAFSLAVASAKSSLL